MDLIRHLLRGLLAGFSSRGNQRLLVDVRQVFGQNVDQMTVTDLLKGLTGRRLIYEAWTPADLVKQLTDLNIQVSRRGRAQSVRSSDVEACDK